jgi:hypothetical protein
MHTRTYILYTLFSNLLTHTHISCTHFSNLPTHTNFHAQTFQTYPPSDNFHMNIHTFVHTHHRIEKCTCTQADTHFEYKLKDWYNFTFILLRKTCTLDFSWKRIKNFFFSNGSLKVFPIGWRVISWHLCQARASR